MTRSDTPFRPIRTERDHRAAVARIGDLIGAAPGSPEGDELDVLATLVDSYEAKHHSIEAPDPLTAFRMEQQELSRRDLEPRIGSRARVSEVLNGKRPLTLEMIRRLTKGLGIPADLLIAPVVTRRFATSLRTSSSRSPKTQASQKSAAAKRSNGKAAA